MSSAQQGGNSQQPSQTWTEPPWCGWIETTGDALLILEAARRGLIPRVTRRLVDSERKMITSGSVFVFDEDESGIKRWTDGFFWSPSRILGNFLLYRETDKRGNRAPRNNDPDGDSQAADGSLSRPKNEMGALVLDKNRERSLCGSLTNSPKFKSDGLMKKTFSLTIAGVAQHLISYYKIEDVENGRLRTPSSLPELASLEISPEYLDKTHFRNAPKVEIGADGVPRYRGEGDEAESPAGSSPSPALGTHPMEGTLPLLTDGHVEPTQPSGRRAQKRFLPYPSSVNTGIRGRNRSKSQAESPGPITLSPSTSSSNSVALSPQPSPPEGNHTAYPQYSSYYPPPPPPPPQGQYHQPVYTQPYPPHGGQYSYPNYATPPAVASSTESETAQSPQSTGSPDHHPQSAPPHGYSPYPYYPPQHTSPGQPHHAPAQPYTAYPTAPSAPWPTYGAYNPPPPPPQGGYQHHHYQHHASQYSAHQAPQHDREHSSGSQSTQ